MGLTPGDPEVAEMPACSSGWGVDAQHPTVPRTPPEKDLPPNVQSAKMRQPGAHLKFMESGSGPRRMAACGKGAEGPGRVVRALEDIQM